MKTTRDYLYDLFISLAIVALCLVALGTPMVVAALIVRARFGG